MLGELVDRIAAMKKHAFVAVDERDLRLAARRRREARIVGESTCLLVERRDIDHAGPTTPGFTLSSSDLPVIFKFAAVRSSRNSCELGRAGGGKE